MKLALQEVRLLLPTSVVHTICLQTTTTEDRHVHRESAEREETQAIKATNQH